jgi:thymidylate synthase ThyX
MENGYIDEEFANNKDVMRGLYMLSIPSNFIFKCNFTEWAHIVKERDCNSHAAPELQEMVEKVCDKLQSIFPQLTKEYWYSIRN